MADAPKTSPPRTSRVLWWLMIVIVIGAVAALIGAVLGFATIWIAVAAGVVAAVLPAYFDGRLRRRQPSGR